MQFLKKGSLEPEDRDAYNSVLALRGITLGDVAQHPEVDRHPTTLALMLRGAVLVTPERLESLAHAAGSASWAELMELAAKLKRLAEPKAG